MIKKSLFALLMIGMVGVLCSPSMAAEYKPTSNGHVFTSSMNNPGQWADQFALSGQQAYVQIYVDRDNASAAIKQGSYSQQIFAVKIFGYAKDKSATSPYDYPVELEYFKGDKFSSTNPVPTSKYSNKLTDPLLGTVMVYYEPASDLTNNKPSIRVYVEKLPYEYNWYISFSMNLKNSSGFSNHFNEAPLMFDDNMYMAIDPIIDMTAPENQIGQQTINFTSTASIKQYTLYKKGNPNTVIASRTISPTANNVAIPVPRSQSKQTYWLGVDLQTQDMDVSIDRPITVKPFHAIGTTSCYQDNNTDEDGLRHPTNVITWSVPYAQDSDAMMEDQFIIERAYLADFSDAVALNSHTLTPDTVKNGIGYYRYVDNDENALTNKKARDKNDPYMYYRISRAMVTAIWPDHKDLFVRVDSVGLDSYLPKVTGIKITKQDDFDESKKVTVRVMLDNPHGNAIECESSPIRDEGYYEGYCGDYRNVYFDRRPIRFEVINDNGTWKWLWKRAIMVENDRVYFDQPNSTDSIWDVTKVSGGYTCIPTLNNQRIWAQNTGQTQMVSYQYNARWNLCTPDKQVIPSIRTQWDDGQSAYFKHNVFVGETRIYQWDKEAQIVIRRHSPDNEHYQGVDYAKKTITIQGSDVTFDSDNQYYYVEFTDVQAAPFTHFYYTARVEKNKSLFIQLEQDSIESTRKEADACYSEQYQSIKSLTATLGTRPDGIMVNWDVDEIEGGGVTIERRVAPLSGQTATDWVTLDLPNDKLSEWLDQKTASAIVYEYKLTSWVSIRGQKYSKVKTVYGWRSYYGSIEGKMQLKNGAAMTGNSHVTVDCDSAFTIPTVCDSQGNILMPGLMVDKRHDTVYADAATGHFKIDSLPYNATGMQYSITPICGCTMSHAQGTGPYHVTLSDARWDYSDIVFTCNDVQRFSGRVLYELSTIPVAGVQFKLNGEVLLQGNGEPIVSDQLGNFEFYVPRTQMRLQLYKEGHTFEKDGYFRDLKDSTCFLPTQNYDNLIMTDLTKIQLVGRIVAGKRMAQLPFGQGLTSNQLGDDMHLELRLEGNNTAWIYYDNNHLDRTSRTDTCALTIQRPNGPGKIDQTIATFEKKRILININNMTGEFVVNLPPARYKITSMSAKGYSTFFNSDEGFEVLNIQDSIEHATYQRIVHAPVTVTYDQEQYGVKTHYLGEKILKNINLMCQEVSDTVAWYDHVTKSVTYTFGYPIFQQGSTYQWRVSAHEDFYYNGEHSRKPYQVALDGGELIVRNALESGTAKQHVKLDSQGQALIALKVNNPTFTLKNEAALRSVNMQVLYQGYYYDAAQVKGFVAGTQKREGGILNLGTQVQLLDVLRDPPGSESFTTREKGTTYNWTYNKTNSFQPYLKGSITGGFGSKTNTGLGLAVTTEVSWTVTVPVNVTFAKINEVTEGEYTMTLTENVSTSRGSYDQGAIADVYIGTLNDYSLITNEHICVIDSASYAELKDGFTSGAYRLLSEGMWNGKKRYLIVGEQYKPSITGISDFYYSQKHILGTVIPNLKRQCDALIHQVDSTDATDWQKLANTNNCDYYVRKSNEPNDFHTWYHPASMKDGVDVVSSCKAAITTWKKIIEVNEKEKVNAIKGSVYKTYSLGQTAITHSESSSCYYNDYDTYTMFPSLGFGASGGRGSDTDTEKSKDSSGVVLLAAGKVFNLHIGGGVSSSRDISTNYTKTTSAGSSFTLSEANNGYMDVEVYRIVDNSTSLDDNIKNDVRESDEYTDDKRLHKFVFYARGGATRSPWIAPDSTLFYEKGTPLSAPMLKIDNPKIYIDRPVASNVPADEKAVFKVRLVNESEVNENTQYLAASKFELRVLHETNPDGAKLTMDGQPLTQALTFTMNRGQTIVKTLEVERGDAYDYPGITLGYRESQWSLEDKATISIHYLPTSTPVHLSSPMDKWILNTLSDKDSTGYFIPVSIDGFDVNYDRFDHIELQYKKHTEGESQWVNLCSFFTSDSLYERCTTVKRMIESGTISNFRFYGEQDPMEMEYDLRAVSFCRLGTGYVTRSSDVITGTKDTRVPTIFGLPQPANGIWNFDDAITLNFSEPIAYNYLDKTANFSVTGYTNDSKHTYSSMLCFSGKNKDQSATTQVARNLSETDFTIDMTVRIPNNATSAILYSQGSMYDNGTQTLMLSYIKYGMEEYLLAIVNGVPLVSTKIDDKEQLAGNIRRVGMAYSRSDSTMTFIIGDHYIDMGQGSKVVCKANDKISIGDISNEVSIANVRLWNHKLTRKELANNLDKRLTGRETGLIAYWPMDETQGNIAHDKANGADLVLHNVTWQTKSGISVRTNGEPFAIQHADYFNATNAEDYTLSFWFNINEVKENPAVLFQVGSDYLAEKDKGKLKIYVNAYGDLALRSNGKEFTLMEDVEESETGQWHHFALSVSRTQNSVIMCIDGQVVQSVSAEHMDGLSSDLVRLGSTNIDAFFDYLAFWRIALPAEYIEQNYNHDLKGNEMELKVYLPMHTDSVKSDNTIVRVFCPYNMAYSALNNAAVKDATSLMLSGANPSEDNHAPVSTVDGLKNLPFSWTSTGTSLQMHINEPDQDINNRPINITVRSVEDLNGNSMPSAQTWMIYAHRNVLEWTESEHSVKMRHNEENTTFEAYWTNKSGRNMSYNIFKNCDWLSCTNTMGKTDAMGLGSTTITIDQELAPGEYMTQLYLQDENELVSTLTIHVTVEATPPDWKPENTKGYSYSMNLCGMVFVNNDKDAIVDMDERDIVSAFHSGKCIGQAKLTVDKQKNTSFLYMNISGNSAMNTSDLPIEFRLWRASTGEIHLLRPDSAILLRKNTTPGCQGNPVRFTMMNSRIQTIDLEEGWNWISFNLLPNTTNGVNNLFLDNDNFSNDDQFRFTDATFSSFYENSQTHKRFWSGEAEKMPISKNGVYQLYVAKACEVKVEGLELPQDSLQITLSSGWNALPCWMRASTPIHNALSDYLIGDKAKVGTVIKSHNQFAVATSGQQWQGSLQYLQPGEGYYVYHLGEPCTVRFIQSASKASTVRLTRAAQSNHASMMPVIAQLQADMPQKEGDEIVAMVGDEEVGRASASIINGQPFFLIALNAEEKNVVHFQLIRNDVVVAESRPILNYNAAIVAGSIVHPFIIDFSENQDDHQTPYYSPDGKRLPDTTPDNMVVITKDKKTIHF